MRIELVHPLIVHFPLALLLTGWVLRFVYFLLRKGRYGQPILFSSRLLIALGVCAAWIAVAFGEIAGDIVGNGLCDQDIFDNHMHLAYVAAAFFTAALIVDLGQGRMRKFSSSAVISVIIGSLYTAAAVILIIVGALGGNLVYEQGAAVNKICRQPG